MMASSGHTLDSTCCTSNLLLAMSPTGDGICSGVQNMDIIAHCSLVIKGLQGHQCEDHTKLISDGTL